MEPKRPTGPITLTDRKVQSLPHCAQRYSVSEAGRTGLQLRIAAAPSKRKTWEFSYRWTKADGSQERKRMRLGEYPVVGVSKARKRLTDAKELLDEGIDPATHNAESRRARQAAPDVETLAERFLANREAKGNRSTAEYRRILFKDVVPAWSGRKAEDIRRKDVAALLSAIAERGAGIAANRTGAIVRSMFTYALRESIVETNPATVFNVHGEETSRQRALSKKELGAFWRGLPDADMPEAARLAIKWSLVTGQRLKEVVKASHVEIDTKAKVWTIPGDTMKGKAPHLVPLVSSALELYAKIKKASGDSPWLFPSPRPRRSKSGHISLGYVSHCVTDNQEALGIEDSAENVTFHDLRRTVATGLGQLGIEGHIIERALDHSQGGKKKGLPATYNTYSYAKEKRAALQKWATHLRKCIDEAD